MSEISDGEHNHKKAYVAVYSIMRNRNETQDLLDGQIGENFLGHQDQFFLSCVVLFGILGVILVRGLELRLGC